MIDMSRQKARGVALVVLSVALWLLVADTTARLFDGPASGLMALLGGGLVGIFVALPGLFYLTGVNES